MTSIIARIERIREGHSERALIHAIDAEGREYKIEVPPAEVSALAHGQSYMLVLSWSIHVAPLAPVVASAAPRPDAGSPVSAAGTSVTEPATSSAAAPAGSVDAQFMALMSRVSAPASSAQPTGTAGSSREATPEDQLANLLGVPSKPTS
jgi:hypothetical protein